MGEVRIKSGNFFEGELEQGSLNSNDGSEVMNNTRVRTVENTLLKEGTYTINCTGATGGVVVYAYNTDDLSYDKAASYIGQWRLLPFTFTVDDERLYRFAFKKADNSVIVPSEVTNIQLLEGTYTSETIPEYQPYFLNKPAHQFINGEWIDIPTHHYINNRWQGELTSQSPLKFRADGEMLDWRVEGRKSGNLFDVNGDIAQESSNSIEISQDQIIITVTATWGRDYVIFDKIFEPGLYTIKIISSSDTSGGSYSIGCLSTAPLTGWTYNDYYAAYVKEFDNTLIIKITDSTRIGFRCSSSQVGQKVTLSNIKLLEGAYTPETIPEHEPYGVGDWDETEQQYKIPITVEGNNLFDGEWKQGTIANPSSSNRVSNKNVISLKSNTVYTIGVRGSSIIQYALVYRDKGGNVTYDSGWISTANPVLSSAGDGATAEILLRRSDAGTITPVSEEILSLKVIFTEGTYTSSTIPLYEVTLFTDHQLMDGDSIDFTTDQTAIPLATGNNTLTVDTAVKPSKVFIKFEG